MVIGNGLIANTLKEIDHKGSIIFASGVSNSKEENPAAYKREVDLLLSQERNKTLIYFSTCSVSDQTLSKTAYVNHKLKMENLVREEFFDYLILRLPTLVGKTNNPHTFFNYLKNKVVKNEEVTIHKNAWRYLLDADDLKILIPALIKDAEMKNKTLYTAYNNAMSIQEIVTVMDVFLKKTSKIKLVDEGSHFQFNNDEFIHFLKKNNIDIYSDSYNTNVILKYLN